MTQLVDTLDALGLAGEVTNGGRWVRLAGGRCSVYVVETSWGGGYLAWCGAPCEGVVSFYRDPAIAIRAVLMQAAGEGERRSPRAQRLSNSDEDSPQSEHPDMGSPEGPGA